MSFPRYPEYKDSSVAWLGEVPAHWGLKPLWTLFRRTKRTGYEDEQLLSVYRDYGVVPKASRDDNNNKPSDDLAPYQLVMPGDLAINKMKAWQGSVAISEHRGIVSPAYFVYESINSEVPRYLHYLMRSPRYITGYLSLSKGIRVNQWDLEPQYHSRMPIVLPPYAEQSAIAAFLDRETAKIDALVAEQEKLIALLKEKRQAVISHAVTKGLDPNVPMKDSGIEWLGEVPVHWKTAPIKHIGWLKGGAGFPHEDQGVEGEELDFHKVNALGQASSDGILQPSENTISRSTAERLGAYVFPARSIVFAKVGAALLLGRIRELSSPACLDNNMMGLVVEQVRNDVGFVRYAMSLVRFDLIANPGTVPSLNESQIGNFMLAAPPLDEQTAIAVYLDRETTAIDALSTEAERAIELLKERRSALISAAVTGKIDVRGLGTESAPGIRELAGVPA